MRIVLGTLALLLFAGCTAQTAKEPALAYRYRIAEESGKPAPLIIFLHGYGSDEHDLFSLAPRFPFSMHVVSLRAPLNRHEGGYSWFNFGSISEQQWNYRYSEAKESRELIAAMTRDLCKRLNADSTKVFLLGFSQGAIMAFETAVHDARLYHGVIALSGGMLPETKQAISAKPATAFFVAHGTQDEILDPHWSEDAVSNLRKAGSDVTFKTYTAGHQIPEAELRDILYWLKEHSR